MSGIYDNILQTVGNTPIVKLNKMAPPGVNVFVKVESFNPMGSVKDRLALGVIEDAERRGLLKPGQTVVEATSGNTGIGLAMVCAQKGYPLVVTMAENFSVERRKMMRFLGAKVVLTPAHAKGTGMVNKAAELAEQHGWFLARQFENPANAEMHYRTTAEEILKDFSEINLDYWVSGFGTGGTLNGVSRKLKEASPNTRIIVCEPDNSQILASGISQPADESHPKFRPHMMQGWSPDFIPDLANQALQADHIDNFMPIDGEDSLRCAKELAQKEGIFVGISGGATLSGALNLAKLVAKGSNILCMLPDTGERYLSTQLFADVNADMNEAELTISRSTDNYRFDSSGGGSAAEAPLPEAEPEMVKEIDDYINNSEQKVVMFALQWCEFCDSVRNALKHYDIEFKSVDLDSVAFAEQNHGGKLRIALRHKTGWNTFPQIFVNGEFVGGCTDIFDKVKNDSLQPMLDSAGISYNQTMTGDGKKDPYDYLPSWLHAR
ncbi:cysteine synthase A [Thalassotalea sp. PS06]|uniref:cysteine synthase A n=1 Tax=Thalassotalea sp. PS06 TaxID=2594005 RepID=UPI001163F44A|nr:cysteine synthase A [Thalassotalea sp. PS06]QDP02687.1 cysteine synthase A [Thalassotalea sp. PS06]